MAKNSKTDAELYREERKARLAKAAKKNSKKQIRIHVPKGAQAAIAIVLVLAIIAGFAYKGYDASNLKVQKLVVMQTNGENISKAEYTYYYRTAFLNVYSQSQQYDQYGAGYGKMYTGYDSTVSPDEQAYPNAESMEGYENPTWSDYFDFFAKEQIKRVHAFVALAKENNLTLDEHDLEHIDEEMASVDKSATEQKISPNALLSGNYGKGINTKMYKKMLEMRSLAQKYEDFKKQEFKDAYKDKEIEAEYKKNSMDYDAVSLRQYTVKAETVEVPAESAEGEEAANPSTPTAQVTDETMAEAEKQAKLFAAAATSDKAFKQKAAEFARAAEEANADDYLTDDSKTLLDQKTSEELAQQYIDNDVLTWAFDHSTKVGATKTVKVDGTGYTVYMISKAAAKDTGTADTYDVRHILVKFPEESEAPTEPETTTEETTVLETAEPTAEGETTTKAAGTEATETTEATEATETTTLETTTEVSVTTLDVKAFGDTNIYLDVDADSASDKAAYKKAQDILLEYLKGSKTEDSFSKLAAKYTEDSNGEQGGLYEEVTDGQMVPQFNDWSLAEGRKAGDVGIVETTYGYHIMYFVGRHENGDAWKNGVLTTLSDADFTDYSDELLKGDSYAITVKSEDDLKAVATETVEMAKRAIANAGA